jgi:hypothetical protein
MFLTIKSQTQSITIHMHDIRQVAQWIVKEAAEIRRYYQNTALVDDVRLARDLGLMFLEEWILSVEVELYEPAANVDPDATHQEPGSFKKFRAKQGLAYRLTVKVNPAKSREETEAFFKLLGWQYVEPLIESGRGKTERDGGFRSGGGFTVERWVYSDDADSTDGNSTEEGYKR